MAASFWLEGLARPKPAAVMMWIANGVNLAVDLVLVPGTFGLPALGAVGGAWATATARTFLAAALIAYIFRMPEARELGVFDKPERDRAAEAEQRRIGFGAGASNFFEVASFASMNVIAGWLGGLAVAAWTIALNVAACAASPFAPFEGFDVLVMPTMPSPAFELGIAAPDRPPEEALPIVGRAASLTSAWNVTGQPAISLPLGTSDGGLPIGVQLIAAYGREDVLLRVAAQLEQAAPWAGRRPPVHA